ncbi:MAG: 30S ribosomal protein S16 [Verrucomicrobia bacterium]|nr:30S ribosomal protein S16 [Verrucomicrobiota bacterium]
MSVSIRLRREGTKNRPFYRIVVADKRSPRDGKFLEAVGNYDPRQVGQNSSVDLPRVDHWMRNGAKPSSTVASIIVKARKRAATEPEISVMPAERAVAPAVPTTRAEPATTPAEPVVTPAEPAITEPVTAG